MIHPDTALRYINDEIGYGVFATAFIPKGTITYVKDELELEIPLDQLQEYPIQLQKQIEKYSYIDPFGNYVLSWDLGKYVNHCCFCNTMSTAYGFEIAIRDIEAGEEITDEYGLMNPQEPMMIQCHKVGCRLFVQKEDVHTYADQWDPVLKEVLLLIPRVNQPLMELIDIQTYSELNYFLNDPNQYKSIRNLELQKKC
jgi:hypothetical protein